MGTLSYLMHGMVPAVVLCQCTGFRDSRIKLLVRDERADLEHSALRLLARLQVRHLLEQSKG